MRGFVALLHREWRGHRTMVFVIAAVVLALSCLGRSVAAEGPWYWTNGSPVFVAVTWLVVVGALAADVVGAEFVSRRIEGLALLPTSLLRVWSSKLAFVGSCAVALLAWILLCQLATFAVFEANWSAQHEWTRDLSLATEIGVPSVLVMMLAATLVERTLPALFLGVIASGAIFAGTVSFLRWLDVLQHEWTQFLSLQIAALALGGASAATFVKGRVHTGDPWRRHLVTAAVLLPAALGVAGVAGWRLWSWRQLDPGDPEAWISFVMASPDGRRVAVSACRTTVDRQKTTTSRVWVLPTDGGGPVVEVARDQGVRVDAPWNPDGTLRVYERCGALCTRKDVDPSNGRTTASTSFDAQVGEPELTGGTVYPWWAKFEAAARWTNGQQFTTTVVWRGQGIERRISTALWLTVSRMPGVVWYSPDGTRVLRLDLASGRETFLFETAMPLSGCWASRDGSRLLVSAAKEHRVISSDDGHVIAGPWNGRFITWPWGAEHGRFVQVYSNGPNTLLDVDTGRSLELGDFSALVRPSSPQIQELSDGRIVVMTVDGRIDLHAANLDLVRHLYPPERN